MSTYVLEYIQEMIDKTMSELQQYTPCRGQCLRKRSHGGEIGMQINIETVEKTSLKFSCASHIHIRVSPVRSYSDVRRVPPLVNVTRSSQHSVKAYSPVVFKYEIILFLLELSCNRKNVYKHIILGGIRLSLCSQNCY